MCVENALTFFEKEFTS